MNKLAQLKDSDIKQDCKRIVVRLSKEESSFLYFTMEANEGLCFYSTIEHKIGQTYRDVEIYSPILLYPELLRLLEALKSEIKFEII
jgi:hypothetical protein